MRLLALLLNCLVLRSPFEPSEQIVQTAAGEEGKPGNDNSKDSPEETAMWENFKKTGNLAIREKLILKYAHYVKYVAGRIKMGLADHIEFEDLVSWGTFGLINSVDKYDISINVKFVTFATKRIRGAIFDGLRHLDWVPRRVRAKTKQLNEALYELEVKLGRQPSDEEIAAHLEITQDDLEKLYEDEYGSFIMSLDESYAEDIDGELVSKYQLVENLAAKNPELSIENEQVRDIVIEAIDKLSDQERLVITLYYYNELTLKEISEIMKLSESRISQLHTKSIFRLRGRLSRLKKDIF